MTITVILQQNPGSKKLGSKTPHRGPYFQTQDLVHFRFTTGPQVGN